MCINVNLHVYNTIVISDTRLNFTLLFIETFSSFYYQVYDLLYFVGKLGNIIVNSILSYLEVSGLNYILGRLALCLSRNAQPEVPDTLNTVEAVSSAQAGGSLVFLGAFLSVLEVAAQHTLHLFSQAKHTLTSTISSFSHTVSWLAGRTSCFWIASLTLCVLFLSLLLICTILLFKILEQIRSTPPQIHHHNHFHQHNTANSIKTNCNCPCDSIKTNTTRRCVDPQFPYHSRSDYSSLVPLIDVHAICNKKVDNGKLLNFHAADTLQDIYHFQDLTVMVATIESQPEPISTTDNVEITVQPQSTSENSSSESDSNIDSTNEEPENTNTYLGIPAHPVQQLTSSRETTPDKKVEKRLRAVSWGGTKSVNSDIQDTDSDASSCSIASSQKSMQNKKKDNWIHEDGCVTLDRGKSCQVCFMNNFLEPESSLSLRNELITAIDKTCSFVNSKRFKIELGNGLLSNHSDIDLKKKPKKKMNHKMSVATVNLDENSELALLINQYRDRIGKAVNEVFNLDVEFDRVIIHRLSGPDNNIAYESAMIDEKSAFSPTVAMLSIGPPEAGARPMFMKTKTGNIVTHKIALTSGSLCTLSGRTECRYRRSIPKDYGTKGDQFFIFFVQRTPDSSILQELLKISLPSEPKVETAQKNIDQNFQDCENLTTKIVPHHHAIEQVTSEEISLPSIPCVSEDSTKTSTLDNAKEHVLITPPTVKRVLPDPITFLDAMDYEVSGGLLLAESLGNVINIMDDNTLTTELIRNHTSIAGSEEQKKRRLQQKLSMSIGELTSSAANNSVNMSQLLSPTENMETFRQDLERVSNSQTCIENTLTHVVESIVNIKEDVSCIRADNFLLKTENSTSKKSPQVRSPSTKEMTSKISECLTKIQQLNENIAATREDLASVQDDVVKLSSSTHDSLKDMQSWHNSAFSDEDSRMIKSIYDYVMADMDPPKMSIYTHSGTQTEESHMTTIRYEDAPATAAEETSNTIQTATAEATTFSWPDPMHLSLKTAVLNNKPIKVCLITDSIMRHINEFSLIFRQCCVHFNRIDRNNSEALGLDRLRSYIRKQKPHIVYVHLGINDIHNGTPVSRIMENFADFERFLSEECTGTKVIFSKPLLNGKVYQDRPILDLRRSLDLYRNTHERNREVINQRIHLQSNDNFILSPPGENASQNLRYFAENDLLHLSKKGKDTMVCNMRDSLHKIFREIILKSSC